jgi:hypothetical protein
MKESGRWVVPRISLFYYTEATERSPVDQPPPQLLSFSYAVHMSVGSNNYVITFASEKYLCLLT